jgi:hypothetical protein
MELNGVNGINGLNERLRQRLDDIIERMQLWGNFIKRLLFILIEDAAFVYALYLVGHRVFS